MTDPASISPEEYFSAVFAASPDMISISLLQDGRYLRVNDAFLENSGYQPVEVIGKTSTELGLWAEENGRLRFQAILLEHRRVRDLNVLFRIKNGETRNFQIGAAVVLLGGQECVVAISRDTTDRTVLVEGLEKSRFLLERAEEMANIGSWELDYRTGKVTASPGASRIYGFDPDQFSVMATEKVPLDEYRGALDTARDNLVKNGVPYDIEFKIRRQNDGEIRDIHSKAQWDKTNRRMFGIIRDVTAEKAAEAKIRDFNRELEALVASRTEELRKANLLLTSALENIRKTQNELVLSEKLAAIGQLTAGIAHEINTPLGAIVSAHATIVRFLGTGLAQTITFLGDLTPGQRLLYTSLAQTVTGRKPPTETGNHSHRRRFLRKQLAALGCGDEALVADLLVDLDLDDLPDRMPGLFRDPGAAAILEKIWELHSAWTMSGVVALAAQKAAEVVSALRQYLGTRVAEDIGVVEVEKDLELALTLLHNKLKTGVTVKKEFAGVRLLGSSHDLSQVWINLMNNAVQAMDYRGSLTIVTENSPEGAVVRIIDSGPGIPESIRDRIFEPFFTTKKPGEGIGIGLDICRKIVERNRGRIEFDSRPGRTCFTVMLPPAAVE